MLIPSGAVLPQLPGRVAGTGEEVPNHLVMAILVTLLCCLPLGIVAIVNAAQVNGKLAAGDFAGARRASRSAKLWSLWSLGVGLVGGILYLTVAIIGSANQ